VHHAADALTELEVKAATSRRGQPEQDCCSAAVYTEETVKASDVRIQGEQKLPTVLPTVGRSTSNYQ
jgi:hypothetical protein